jgi:hypothetical protein
MTRRENVLRAIRFEQPERIPMSFHINAACWHHYEQAALQDLMASHPLLFPGYTRKPEVKPSYALVARKDQPYTDPWGCVWSTTDNGITGSVHHHPLADWAAFGTYRAPDPEQTDGLLAVDWRATAARIEAARSRGDLIHLGLYHGHTFLRLQDLRGYENLIFDMADEHPRLPALVQMVEQFNAAVVRKYLALRPDILGFPEDLGMQVGPMLSPENFRRYVKPSYERLIRPAREQGCIIHMHSDGDIRSLVHDIVLSGVQVINLQDLVNGIDWIAANFAGRVCIDLDIDRQQITARGTPAQIDALIREEVTKLASRRGGLMMIYGLYPGVPLANVKALMDAMEKYAGYYS